MTTRSIDLLASVGLILATSACANPTPERSTPSITGASAPNPSAESGFSTQPCPAFVDTHDTWACTQIDSAPTVYLPGEFTPEPACLGLEPFGFFHRFDKDTPNLVIHLQAGGHCIGEQCEHWLETRGTAATNAPTGGIFDQNNPDLGNPFADYNEVRIPYCSGDTHAGHVTLSGEGVDGWQQHGFDNVVATLDYISKTYGEQLKGGHIVFSGSSAGGIGTILDAPLLPTFFADAGRISVLSDSAAGVQSSYDVCLSYKRFGLDYTLGLMGVDAAPDCATSLEAGDPIEKQLSTFATSLWSQSVAAHPDWQFAYIGSQHDQSQSSMNVTADHTVCAQCTFQNEVSEILGCFGQGGSSCSIEAAPNLNYFVYAGTQHTILASGDLYKRSVSGTSAAAWLTTWLGDSPDSLACEDCLTQTNCDACPMTQCACIADVSCPARAECPAAITATPKGAH